MASFSCSPIDCCRRVIVEWSLCQELKSTEGLVDSYNVAVSKLISDLMASVEANKAFKYRIFISTDLFHGHIDMADDLECAGDVYYPRAPYHTSLLGSMSVYKTFRNCQCLK